MHKNINNIIVGISVGDLNGIGPEVILKTLEDTRILEFCTPIIFANVKVISFLKKRFNLQAPIVGIDHIDQALQSKINVLNVWKEPVTLNFGTLEDEKGKYAILSFTNAVEQLKNNHLDILITAPIHKENIQSDSFKFPGHTDFLEQELEGNSMMLMVSNELKVGLLTDHIPLEEVAKTIDETLIRKKVTTLIDTLKKDFSITKPKIAILGLNPHCGDNGVIGNHDNITIKPAIDNLFNEGHYVFGPYASDSFFGSNAYKNFDAVLACYHDQGLIPFKTIAYGTGINYTAGLSKIRTSPDHGTGFDIAGKNKANHQSFTNALYLAIDIHKNRKEYQEITENVLKISKN
ncbi:MAG: 4-hydroxythreonine-4-phosphate dehydrogenase PdxA [Flavobacterium sp.]|jgi:4-hydroxythreonine-4-phosphate dehydrogenase